MFQDEAGFGRINKPKYCWCEKGTRPTVPCHHIREYRYVYGAVEPKTGESCFRIMPYCNTNCMNVFLKELSAVKDRADDFRLRPIDFQRPIFQAIPKRRFAGDEAAALHTALIAPTHIG